MKRTTPLKRYTATSFRVIALFLVVLHAFWSMPLHAMTNSVPPVPHQLSNERPAEAYADDILIAKLILLGVPYTYAPLLADATRSTADFNAQMNEAYSIIWDTAQEASRRNAVSIFLDDTMPIGFQGSALRMATDGFRNLLNSVIGPMQQFFNGNLLEVPSPMFVTLGQLETIELLGFYQGIPVLSTGLFHHPVWDVDPHAPRPSSGIEHQRLWDAYYAASIFNFQTVRLNGIEYTAVLRTVNSNNVTDRPYLTNHFTQLQIYINGVLSSSFRVSQHLISQHSSSLNVPLTFYLFPNNNTLQLAFTAFGLHWGVDTFSNLRLHSFGFPNITSIPIPLQFDTAPLQLTPINLPPINHFNNPNANQDHLNELNDNNDDFIVLILPNADGLSASHLIIREQDIIEIIETPQGTYIVIRDPRNPDNTITIPLITPTDQPITPPVTTPTVPTETQPPLTEEQLDGALQRLLNALVGDMNIDFTPITYMPNVTEVFPFSIPWDFARAFESLSVPNRYVRPPTFRIDFEGTPLDYGVPFEMDLGQEEFAPIVAFYQWSAWIMFHLSLMALTLKIVRL